MTTPQEKVVEMMQNLEEAVANHKHGRDWPIRQESAKGLPKPETSIERRCHRCGASFIGLAAGKTGERGIWDNWHWFCSKECHDA